MTTRRTTLAAIAGAALTPVAFAGQPASATTTLILVRHAEKQDDGRDPDLSARGRQRADMLVKLLEAVSVTRIFATEYKRTQQTVAPLATAQGVDVESYAARDPAAFADSIGAGAGGVVVAAGHSNTVPAIAGALGVTLQGLDDRGFLDEAAYDRVIILTLHGCEETPVRAVASLDLRLSLDEA